MLGPTSGFASSTSSPYPPTPPPPHAGRSHQPSPPRAPPPLRARSRLVQVGALVRTYTLLARRRTGIMVMLLLSPTLMVTMAFGFGFLPDTAFNGFSGGYDPCEGPDVNVNDCRFVLAGL